MGVRVRLIFASLAALLIVAACGTPQAPQKAELVVTLAGAGSGTVTSDPAGIDSVAGELSAEFVVGTEVTLTAAPAAGSTFEGFTGATCEAGSTDTTCVLTVDDATAVTATFALIPPETATLSVVLAGAGSGAVTSDPSGIDTAATQLSATFEVGTEVTLTAVPAADAAFGGFSGVTCEAGSTDTTCVLTLDADETVTATFDALATLTVAVATGGGAAGAITSDPAGIDTAAGQLSAEFLAGTPVTLTAAATTGSFAGWTGGDCDGLKTLDCIVTVDVGEPTVTANFNAVLTLEVSPAANADDAVEFLSDSAANPTDWPEGWVWANWPRFDLGYDPDHTQTEVGLRFPNVALPAGANVLEAVLRVSAHTTGGTAGALSLAIRGQLAADAPAFPEDPLGAPSFNITDRTNRTTASTTWNISGAWTANEAYESNDVADVVSEVVALPCWGSGSTIVLFLSNTNPTNTESRRVWSFDGVGAGDARLPTLVIEYVPLP